MVETPNNPLFSTGSVIDGKWILMERIGKGGMGEVYRAHQLNLKRDVTIKIISKRIDDIVRKATAEKPGDRYQTISEMRAALIDGANENGGKDNITAVVVIL